MECSDPNSDDTNGIVACIRELWSAVCKPAGSTAQHWQGLQHPNASANHTPKQGMHTHCSHALLDMQCCLKHEAQPSRDGALERDWLSVRVHTVIVSLIQFSKLRQSKIFLGVNLGIIGGTAPARHGPRSRVLHPQSQTSPPRGWRSRCRGARSSAS